MKTFLTEFDPSIILNLYKTTSTNFGFIFTGKYTASYKLPIFYKNFYSHYLIVWEQRHALQSLTFMTTFTKSPLSMIGTTSFNNILLYKGQYIGGLPIYLHDPALIQLIVPKTPQFFDVEVPENFKLLKDALERVTQTTNYLGVLESVNDLKVGKEPFLLKLNK